MRESAWRIPGLVFATMLFASAAFSDVYVANESGPSVTVYAPTAAGNAAPVRTISGSNTNFNNPESVFADTVNNELYVADFFGMAVRVFPLNATGNVAPIRTLIDGPNSGLNQVRDVVIDTVHNEMIVVSGNNSIRVYPRTANGDIAPTRVIQGANTKLNNPISLAFNPVADELFTDSYDVSGPNVPGILVFNRTDTGNIAPKRMITGSNTQFGTFVNYVSVDVPNGEVFAQGDNGTGVVVFNLTDNGNVAPKRNLTGGSTQITVTGGMIVDDAANRLIVANQNPASLLAFSRTASGDAPPLVTVAGGSTALASPFGLALDVTGGLTATVLPAAIPMLGWEGLIALSAMMALLGFVALRR